MPYQPQSGDRLAFSGNGGVSRGIKFFCYWYRPWDAPYISHVGLIEEPTGAEILHNVPHERICRSYSRFDDWNIRPLLFESTTLADTPCEILGRRIHGVQAHSPIERIARYDGTVYLLRLTPPYVSKMNTGSRRRLLRENLLRRIGDRYDGRGAILAGTQVVKHWWAWSRADRSSLFCSEYLAWALNPVDMFDRENSGKVTPASFCRSQIDQEVCHTFQRLHVTPQGVMLAA